jgi:hypothetical protein
MASLLLACAAICSDRVSKRRKARREGKKDYEEHFETLKAENMRRESWRQSLTNPNLNPNHAGQAGHANPMEAMAQVPGGVFDTGVPGDAPPSYEDIAVRKSMEHSVDGTMAERTPRD